jgi:hypothetical protein
VVETVGTCPLPQVHQSHQSPFGLPIPETPLRVVELIQGMAANPAVRESVDTFRELLKIRKSHRNVEAIQHVLRLRRYLLVNASQTGIAIGKNCGDVVSVTPHCRMARSTALTASEPPLRTKAKRVVFPSPWSALPATTSKFRSGRWCRFLTHPPSKPTTNSFAGSFDDEEASTSADFCRRLPTFIVRLRTELAFVWQDKGKSSPRKSATFPNGYNAAILAVRYRNSRVVGFLLVKSVEKLRACDMGLPATTSTTTLYCPFHPSSLRYPQLCMASHETWLVTVRQESLWRNCESIAKPTSDATAELFTPMKKSRNCLP